MLGNLSIYITDNSKFYVFSIKFELGNHNFTFRSYKGRNSKYVRIPRKVKPQRSYVRYLFNICSFGWCVDSDDEDEYSNLIYQSDKINIELDYIFDFFRKWLDRREVFKYGNEGEKKIVKKILKCW